MKASINSRLKALRDSTFQEEQDFHKFVVAEKAINVSVIYIDI